MSRRTVGSLLAAVVAAAAVLTGTTSAAHAATPKIWVLSDLSEPGGGTDRDDIVSLAALSTYASEFHIATVSVGSTTVRIDCGAALDYAREAFADRISTITRSSTCGKDYSSLKGTKPGTVGGLVTAIRAGGLKVLNWGPMTEAALAVRWIEQNAPADLAKVDIVTHWTASSPGYSGVYNCSKDAVACGYLHAMATSGKIKLTELGAAGQKFVDQANDECRADTDIPARGLGRYFNVTKDTGTPDLSDGSTFMLMVTGGLSGYTRDGSAATNFRAGYDQLCSRAPALFDHFRANL